MVSSGCQDCGVELFGFELPEAIKSNWFNVNTHLKETFMSD